MEEHPAVHAWLQLRSASMPVSVEVLKKVKPKKSLVYRLTGAAPDGTAVIAKRCRLQTALKEQAMFERVLPRLDIDSLRFHGAVPDADDSYRWVFLEDAGDREIAASETSDLARWVARLHSEIQFSDPVFPEHGLTYYSGELALARRAWDAADATFGVIDAARLATDQVRRLLDVVAERWPEIERMWDATPHALIHGDLVAKNVRMRGGGARLSPCVFDWEAASYGSPGIDLVTCGRTYHDFPDDSLLESYCSIVRSAWTLTNAELRALLCLGMIFRSIKRAVIDSTSFPVGPRPWLIQRVHTNAGQLERCLKELGWC
jgi:hypothetical protein